MKFNCPKCKQRIEVGESYAGQSANCPTCSEALTIPFPPEQTPQPVKPTATNDAAEDVKTKKTTSSTVSNLYLVYELSDSPEIFEVEPRYIKNEKFSAKNLKTNRARSFSFSGMLGLFEDRSDAEALLLQVEALLLQVKNNEAKSREEIEKLQDKADKNDTKIERLEEQHGRLEERSMKKGEVIEDLELRASIEGLTEKQAERLAKANLDEAALGEKMESLEGKIESLEKLNETNQEEMETLEEGAYASLPFFEELETKCLFKLHSLGIEDRTEAQAETQIIDTPETYTQTAPPPTLPPERVETTVQRSSPMESRPSFIKKIVGVFTRK
mgnify:CR=1 FL=1